MRENRTSGSTRGRASGRNSRLFLSTLLLSVVEFSTSQINRQALSGGTCCNISVCFDVLRFFVGHTCEKSQN